MQLKYKRWIKDPWIFFSFFAVFVAIGLIIVPQFRLMFSSIKEERGIFFLRLQSDTGIAKAISEGTKGFEIEEINGLLTIKKNDKQLLTIESWGEGKILLTVNNGKEIDFEVVSGLSKIPKPADEYAMVIQCGGCVVTRKQLQGRLKPFINKGIPVSNYGLTIAWINGIFERVTEPFSLT